MGIAEGTLLAYAAIAGTVISAGTAIYSADQARSNANKAADQAEADAAAAQGQAEVEAAKIRKAAKAQQSAAVAALAASGVDVSTGTAEQIQTDIGQRGEEDALATILGGTRRYASGRQQAALDRYGGGQAATASVLTGLSSVARSASGWKGGGTPTRDPWDLSYGTRGSGD